MATATKTKNTEPPSVADAVAEAEEAAALVDALEDRIRTGDTTVTPAELENARQLATFAAQLVVGAEHRARQAKVVAATKALTKTAKTLAETVTSDQRLIDTKATLTKALVTYFEACDDHAVRVGKAVAAFTDARFEAADLEIDTSAEKLGIEVENSAVYTLREEDGARQVHLLADIRDTTEQLRAAFEPAGLTLRGQVER